MIAFLVVIRINFEMGPFVGRWMDYYHLFHTKHAPVSVGPLKSRKAATTSADVSFNQRVSLTDGCDRPVSLALKTSRTGVLRV